MSTAADSGFSGSVLIVEKGRVLIREGYGSANREKQVPITPETAFDIGSISKQFTKAAVLLLEDRGDLSTDDPLSKFFPEAPEDKVSVTIGHLIDHTSGLHEYHDTEGDFEPMDREEALQRILSQELRFPVGEKQAYSNSGYTLLAIIVEEASEQPFQEFLRENLLEPAGMSRTNEKWNLVSGVCQIPPPAMRRGQSYKPSRQERKRRRKHSSTRACRRTS